MAKKDDKKIKGIDQPESAGSKLVTALIALIIIIIWMWEVSAVMCCIRY